MPKRKRLGLDIGTRFIKAVELTEDETGLSISGFGVEEVADPAQKASSLQSLLARTRLGGSLTVSNVSGRNVIVRHTPITAANEQDLPGVVKVELGKYIPFEIDEVEHDFSRMEDGGDAPEAGKPREFRIALVAAKKAHVQEHIQILKGAHLKPSVVDVDVFALGNAYETAAAVDPKSYDMNQIVALVDIGATKTDISILRGGTLFFTREFYIGGDDITDAIAKKLEVDPKQAETLKRAPGDQADRVREAATTVFDDLCHEINLSIDFFENQHDKKVEAFFLSGGGSQISGLAEAVERTFDKSPTQWNPAGAFPVTPGSPVNVEDLKRAGPMLAIALGLAARIRN